LEWTPHGDWVNNAVVELDRPRNRCNSGIDPEDAFKTPSVEAVALMSAEEAIICSCDAVISRPMGTLVALIGDDGAQDFSMAAVPQAESILIGET